MKSLAYAEKAVQDASPPARIFNCRKRTYTLLCRRMAVLTAHMCTGAHANTLENAPCVITLCVPQSIHPTISIYAQVMLRSLLSGLRYPTFTALSVGLWSICRIIYTVGYGSGDPKQRITGSRLSALAMIGAY